MLVDSKVSFFNRILNMFFITASNRSLFGTINEEEWRMEKEIR